MTSSAASLLASAYGRVVGDVEDEKKMRSVRVPPESVYGRSEGDDVESRVPSRSAYGRVVDDVEDEKPLLDLGREV